MNDAEPSTSGAVMDDFDVFLNHRGPDVKATFVAHLEDALRHAGFRPFLDARSLLKGNPALKSIDQALDMARVHVAVVSRKYAESKYCLDELVAMMRSGKPVIPVFYDVEPMDLRRVEKGPFAEAFKKHKSRGRSEERVQEWRDALEALAALTGFRLADYKSDEAKLKREVVNEVARLTPSNQPLEVDQYRVGLEGPTKACIQMLENMGDGVGVLGLVGVGGVGKTTLARELYNHYVAEKKFRCMTFLEIHRDPSSSNVQVQPAWSKNFRQQLLWDLLRVQDTTSNYSSWFQKVSTLGPVFIVIDDVHKLDQFEALVPSTSFLYAGSRIVITSRDRSILNNVTGRTKVHHHVYDVSTLAWDESKTLFNWHAFNAKEAPEEYKEIAEDIVKACGGLPPALKVIGSSLFDKRMDGDRETIWPEAIDTLRKGTDVMDVLRWSYDSLSEAEKLMFMDICCVFYDWTVKEALGYWIGCSNCISSGGMCTPYTSLRNLMNKNLVVVQDGYSGCFGVHDLLRDLGQEIATKCRRHFVDDRIMEETFVENEVLPKMGGINLERSRKEKLNVTDFASMPNLHFLRLPNGCCINGNFGSMPKKLRLLQWRRMPLAHIPMDLNLSFLISLDFSHSPKLALLWTKSNDSLKACPNLLRLNLEWCNLITKLPNSIGQLSQLQHLNLCGCTELKKLPNSIGELQRLDDLNLSYCTSLQALPETIAYPKLRQLHLDSCKSISKLPDSIGQLKALETLDLFDCTSLKALPDTIGDLSNLQELNTRECTSLVKIPSTIGLMPSLQSVQIIGSSPECQPFTDGNIGRAWSQLQTLLLENWGGLGSLLDYGALKSLKTLYLRDNTLLNLPESFVLLIHLDFLSITCEKLQSLPKSIGELKMLKTLELIACNNLRRLPKALGVLTSLESLEINCCLIKKLPKSIGHLSQLSSLRLKGCTSLQKIPKSIRQLKTLREFQLEDCGSIEAMGALKTLQGLPIWGNTSITKLPASLAVVSTLVVYTSEFIPWCGASDLFEVGAYEVLEEDDSGFLRAYEDKRSGVTGLLRHGVLKEQVREAASQASKI